MNKFNETRTYFPYLKNGITYFNHAAIGPISSRVKEKLDEFLLQRSELFIENYFETRPLVKSAKRKLARILNVNTESVAWVDNVSNALNIIAQGISCQTGDQIILNDIEFPSNVYPFMNLKSQGVEILFAKSENGIVDLPQIEKLVTAKTKLISISAVQFLTGYRADLKSIGEFCKKHKIIFCVDGIQAVGVVRINPIEYNIDFFAGGTQKWLMGLQGLSYFYISPNLFDKITQKFVGWTSVKNAWNLTDFNLELVESAERFQNGTNSRIGMIAIEESLSLFEKLGYSDIENRILNNSEFLINQLKENGFDPVLKGLERNNLSGIVTFKSDKADTIIKELKNNKIICSLREGMIRVSPHFYNTTEELKYFVEELKKINLS